MDQGLGPMVPIWVLCFFFTFKVIHIRKNEWLYRKIKRVVRLDELYRLVPLLTTVGFYFLRYGPLSVTMLFDTDSLFETFSSVFQIIFAILVN